MTEIQESTNTIFDDVFRTIVEKMPRLVIPLINEVFGTDYSVDEKVTLMANEFSDGEKVVSDSQLMICDRLYHIECQSSDDRTMAVRMVEYDLRSAIRYARRDGRRYQIRLPQSCVLYLRSCSTTPDHLEVEILFPDGRAVEYRVPTVILDHYSKEEILRKDLLMLLPFYALRYEKETKKLEEDSEKLHLFLKEYEEIRLHLEKEFEEYTELYTDLITLIVKIAEYIFRKEEIVKKGIGDVMGGKVLELESERLYKKGFAQGITQGITQGIPQGVSQEKEDVVIRMGKRGYNVETIADATELSVDQIKKILENRKD